MIIFQKKKIIHFSNGDYCYILKKKNRERGKKIIINKTSIHNGIPGKKFSGKNCALLAQQEVYNVNTALAHTTKIH